MDQVRTIMLIIIIVIILIVIISVIVVIIVVATLIAIIFLALFHLLVLVFLRKAEGSLRRRRMFRSALRLRRKDFYAPQNPLYATCCAFLAGRIPAGSRYCARGVLSVSVAKQSFHAGPQCSTRKHA